MSKQTDGKLKLLIELAGLRPKVWRELQVPAGATLHQLHMILQTAMEWNDVFNHYFNIDGETYTIDQCISDEPSKSSLDTRLAELLHTGDNFTYVYEIEDPWKLDVEVVGSGTLQQGEPPVCTGGEQYCPPVEFGGGAAYSEVLQEMQSPTGTTHDQAATEFPQSDQVDVEHLNDELKWYWKHRDPQKIDWSISNVCNAFLEDMQGETTQLTWIRCQRNLISLMAFLNVSAPAQYPVDRYLLDQRGLNFTDISGLSPMFDLLDWYFALHLVWKKVASPAVIRDNKATLLRLVKWLRGIDRLQEEISEILRRLIESCAQQAQEILTEDWHDFEYAEVNPAQADTIREGFFVADTGESSLSLMTADTISVLQDIKCPAELIPRLNEGKAVGAEIATTPDGTNYLTGLLLFSKPETKEQSEGGDEAESR